MKFHRFLAALPLLAASLWAATPAVDELVLPERIFPQLDGILKTAVQQSPRMLNRALDLEIAENNRIQARAGLLPSLGASYRYYQARDNRADQNGWLDVAKTYYDATLTQPLFYWGERRNNARIGEIRANIAKGQYGEGYHQLVQTLRSDYMGLIVLKLGVKRAQYYLEYSNDQLKQQEERLAKKVISEAQIYTARLAAEQAQIARERVEFDFENAKASYARLAGMGSIVDETIPDSIPVAAYSAGTFDQLLSGFLAQKDPPTTEAVSLRQQLDIEKLNYAIQKTNLRPKINAVLGTNQDEQSFTVNVAQKYRVTSYFAGVSVNWSIFDGFSSGAAVRSSLARRRQMENDYNQLTERLAQDAQSQVKQINFSARNMSIYDRALASSEGSLKTMQEDFHRGARSEADVSQAQLGLYDARINAYNARIDYLLKIGEFLGTIVADPVAANLSAK